MKFRHRKRGMAPALLLLIALTAGCATSPSVLSPYSPDARRVAVLTWLMFAVAGVVLAIITVLLWLAFRRSRSEIVARDLYAGDRLSLRYAVLGGGALPILVLLLLMGFGIGIENTALQDIPKGTADIEVIGHQWWWEIRYANQNFASANEIHIPVRQPVRLHVTSADVIHSFWVPELGGKIDLIPGQSNTVTIEADKPGIYRGQCAEFCGAQHAHMALLVIAENPQDFQAWLQDQGAIPPQPAEGSLEQQGQQAFLGSACVYCHTIQGTNASGQLGPDLTHLASRLTIGAGLLPNTSGNLAGWITNSQGPKPEHHMPPMDLNAAQLQAMLAYLESLK